MELDFVIKEAARNIIKADREIIVSMVDGLTFKKKPDGSYYDNETLSMVIKIVRETNIFPES